MRRYACGCRNAVDPASGVLRCVSKCSAHRAAQRDPRTLDEAYYREIGALDADAPARYVSEIEQALGPIPNSIPHGQSALEIGGGASPYAEYLRACHYHYSGVDLSEWACYFMRRRMGANMTWATFESADLAPENSLVLAAHAFEHMTDAPAAIRKAASLLASGGELWVIVPDDSDLTNPDHFWFFTPETLRATVEQAGLTVERFAIRQHIEREQFLYLRARKP